jgi:transposase
MPRLPPALVPKFTDEQLARARHVAAQTSAPHRSVLRAKLTLVLASEPLLSHREAGRKAGVSFHTVRKWRRRWARDGWSLEDAPRSGRPPAFSPSGRGPRQGVGL